MYYLCTKFIKAINNVNLKQLTMSQLKKYLESFKNLETKLEVQDDGYTLTIKHESLWSSDMVESTMTFDLDGNDLCDYKIPRQLK